MDPVAALREIAYYKDRAREDSRRVMAYRNAADTVERLDDAEREKHGTANSWQSLPGIGPKTAKVIAQAWSGRDPDTLVELRSAAMDLGGGEIRAALRGAGHGWSRDLVHEVKVRRADLLSDLRRASKRAAYLQLSSETWYVIGEGIATVDEIPAECGVLIASANGLEVARPAPKRPMRMPFQLWMALARATPLAGWRLEDEQRGLGDTSES